MKRPSHELVAGRGKPSLPVRIALLVTSFTIVLGVAWISGGIAEPKKSNAANAAKSNSEKQPQATTQSPAPEKADPPKAKKRTSRPQN